MSRCPVCHSVHILPVKVNSQGGGFCRACGSQWIRSHDEQKRIKRGRFAPSSLMAAQIRRLDSSSTRAETGLR
jgi:hypothetical protein